MQYIEAPSDEEAKFPTVFLAGGITNCPDWQSEMVKLMSHLDLTIYNPRRKEFDVTDTAAAEVQIMWEYYRLVQSDLISFWFSSGSLNPIVLFELGAALGRGNQFLQIGIDPKYERMFDVEMQTLLAAPSSYMNIEYSLVGVVREIEYRMQSSVWRTATRMKGVNDE